MRFFAQFLKCSVPNFDSRYDHWLIDWFIDVSSPTETIDESKKIFSSDKGRQQKENVRAGIAGVGGKKI